jgi:hypothetical protein
MLCMAVLTNPVFTSAQKLEPSKNAWSWADKQLKKMSVDEKVGQLIHVGINARFAIRKALFSRTCTATSPRTRSAGSSFSAPRSMKRFTSPTGCRSGKDPASDVARRRDRDRDALSRCDELPVGDGRRCHRRARTRPPHGRDRRPRSPCDRLQHVLRSGTRRQQQCRNPVINVRSFGEDPEDVSRFGNAFAAASRANASSRPQSTFPGHGDTAIDSHRGLPIIDLDRERLDSLELLPFKRAIEAGIGSIMIAHIACRRSTAKR